MTKYVIITIFVLYCIGKFMEGYNKLDHPSQARKQTKLLQEQNRTLKEQNELEILKLKKEIEELKLKNKE